MVAGFSPARKAARMALAFPAVTAGATGTDGLSRGLGATDVRTRRSRSSLGSLARPKGARRSRRHRPIGIDAGRQSSTLPLLELLEQFLPFAVSERTSAASLTTRTQKRFELRSKLSFHVLCR